MNIKIIFVIFLFTLSACNSKTKDELYAQGIKQLEASNPGGAVILFKSALEQDENYLDARFQLAKCYAKLGKLEQAEKEFNKVLKQNPARDEVLIELAGVLNASKKGDEAFKLGQQYLAIHPGSAEGFEVLGIASAVNKRFDDAERYLLQSVAADQTRAKTKLELAAVYVSVGKEAKAKDLLNELIRTDPKNARPLFMLAAMETRAGNRDKALEIYHTIMVNHPEEAVASYKIGIIHIEKGDLDKADKTADDLLSRFPKRADGHRLKGLVSYHRKNYAEAMNYLQSSLKIAPTLEAYHFLGLCYYNRGELESALSQFRIILDHVPDSRQARLMTGTILLAQKRLDDAVTEIQKVLQKDDRDAVAHNLLGNAYMAKGMFEDGMREFNKATKIDPKIVDAYLKKGYFYFSRGKNVEGETELTTAVQAAPDALNSRLLLASYHLRSGKGDKALSVLKSGLTGKKSDAFLYNSIAAVYFSLNNQGEGLKSIQKAKDLDPAFPASYQNMATYFIATGKYDKAIAEYTALLRNVPTNVQAILGLAGLYEIKGNDNEALAYYQKAVDTKQPAAFMAKAGYHLKKRENSKALKVLDEALEIDAKNVAALEMKGRLLVSDKKYKAALRVFEDVEAINPEAGIALKIGAYVTMKDTEKAVEQAQKIIEKYPSSARGYMVLGSIYESQKDYARAIGEVKKGLRVDGNNPQAFVYLGNLYEASRDYTQAMTAYEEACRKKPDFVPALFAQGALLDQSGKKKEAVSKYRTVLEKSNNYVPALNNLAYLCASGYGSKEEALRLAITAFKREAGNAGIMDTLGFALLKNNRLEDAKKVLEKAVSMLPDNPTVTYHLALAYKESGDKPNALKTLQKALKQGDFADAKAAALLVAELKK
ncbi:MAG: PEP-CTERM system TPR-repeat protein PrsT [Deltaproteobacteria bacterium]|nr:PEP-CTERM system TPR-repeat protein PrsT [Deltaproteobacteria bacterium]